ncbi:hypothetical protein A2994_00770 [candidate division Kazan bacterium RIFCSPLOWO2_01_FULL_48_13]|uniref:Uncharacterized protein n=1 Tax=candidate division Kazan bacterium RIFCSPLOWO2_01_FULL_48_13 TaxID=1798539 RepID=A0A1F4PR81_UNCK3|nr:MAG: hypothetical protein A2994_00770 [candidate division Kazan bacterium RIFCSPLOWO2_01_FULL_48_13]
MNENGDSTAATGVGRLCSLFAKMITPRPLDEVIAGFQDKGVMVCLSLEELLDESRFIFNSGHRYTVPKVGQDDEPTPAYLLEAERREGRQPQVPLSDLFKRPNEGLTLSEGICSIVTLLPVEQLTGMLCFGSRQENMVDGMIEFPMVRISKDDPSQILVEWVDLNSSVDEAAVWWVTQRHRKEDER